MMTHTIHGAKPAEPPNPFAQGPAAHANVSAHAAFGAVAVARYGRDRRPAQPARTRRNGPETFGAAAAELLSWQAHLRAGLRVTASTATAEPGTLVLLGIGVGPLRLRAPCRVIYTVTDPLRKGFAYGTLPGHPESGEEAFTISLRDDGLVVFTITAFSRPATTAARAAGPLGLLIQRHFTQAYLRALEGRRDCS